HVTHGFVELSALPRFDEARRGDPEATRRHRRAMTLAEHAFLQVEVDGSLPRLEPDPSDAAAPHWSGDGIEVRCVAPADGLGARQSWSIAGLGRRRSVTLRLRGALDRPALAEITELDPPMPTGAQTAIRAQGGTVLVEASGLSAIVAVTLDGAAATWERVGDELHASLDWPDTDELAFQITVALQTDARSAGSNPASPSPAITDGHDPLTSRALAYIRGCTALVVGTGERAILTDHRILPLSWTRDAYWQALALLAADGPGDRDRVADHLRWLWRRCERPDGRWVRSHHANGRRKDLAFQADQQLYAIVELADYWRVVGSLPAGVGWDTAVATAWRAAVDEVDPTTGLIACAENAADDPAVAPFITASQILLWYAGQRLLEMLDAAALSVGDLDVRGPAAAAREGFTARMVDGGAPWPYAVDGSGGRVAYHDANDLPVALAPLWGFCAADDPGWLATMRFAFGPDNPGWDAGLRPGLGSAHTPGPWTLGDIQAWIHGRTLADGQAMAMAFERLEAVAFFDSMLPEAYSADPDEDLRQRHWFAWPGATIAALRLLDEEGRLERQLSAFPTR
ncbi:MAG: glycoside hydrolase family 125 protein, partial [Candidatus Limnocylindria bacterium]